MRVKTGLLNTPKEIRFFFLGGNMFFFSLRRGHVFWAYRRKFEILKKCDYVYMT